MTMPLSYAHASEDFERFIVDARDRLSLATRHQPFTVVQSVLWVFRKRREVSQAIAFAQVLPPVFVRSSCKTGTRPSPAVPFGEREELAREVQSVRGDHNFAPGDAIDTVAATLRRHIDRSAFDAVLASMPGNAAKYWAVRVR